MTIGLHVLVFGEQFARNCVAFAFHDARVEVVIAELQMREAPVFHQADLGRKCPFIELGIRHIAIVSVFVGMGVFLAVAGIPNEAFLVACKVDRAAK